MAERKNVQDAAKEVHDQLAAATDFEELVLEVAEELHLPADAVRERFFHTYGSPAGTGLLKARTQARLLAAKLRKDGRLERELGVAKEFEFEGRQVLYVATKTERHEAQLGRVDHLIAVAGLKHIEIRQRDDPTRYKALHDLVARLWVKDLGL